MIPPDTPRLTDRQLDRMHLLDNRKTRNNLKQKEDENANDTGTSTKLTCTL